ncbi:alpha/beta fold hydrolase [Silicimonas sp. MF1-12-2]|uniref:alpha/beta fold hydrolase n=1 Tax=Silicimonas sp. MF1-12-2 TaxID=3384793 RepID=UPI0039B5E2D6
MKPLVLVHGFMGGSDQWALQKPLAKGRDLIAVDLPGFGKNAHLAPVASIAGFADWVLAELARRGVSDFDLLGHSMGGMIVQEMVRLAPHRVARLILYGTGAVGLLPGRFEPIETSMDRAKRDGASATARRISATWFLESEASQGYPACAKIAEQSTLPAILAGLEAMRDWSGQDNLALISAETLIVWGDGDRTYPWSQIELLWRAIPNSHLAVLPLCAHAVHMERPDLFNRIVGEFLARS